MNQETANYIMQRMSKYLDNSQMIRLKDTLVNRMKSGQLTGFLLIKQRPGLRKVWALL